MYAPRMQRWKFCLVFYEANRRLGKNRHLGEKKRKFRKRDIYVVRIRADGSLAMSRPCMDCLAALKRVGIRRIYYSTNQGKICMELAKLAETSHCSGFQRHCEDSAKLKRYRF